MKLTCIACNQACLDHIFEAKTATCLVNPRACNETTLNYIPTTNRKRIAVVGAGPAGLAFATTAASRGHDVTLYEASSQIGGQVRQTNHLITHLLQFNLAKQVPGMLQLSDLVVLF